MTSPIVFQDPGFGGAIEQGFTPLLVMLQHQQEMRLKKNQLDQEQQRIDLEAQRTQSSISADAAQRAAAKMELKQRQLAYDEAVKKFNGESEAGALFNSLVAKNLQPGTSEWNNAYAQAVGQHAGKDYGTAFVDKFGQLVSNDFELKHKQAITNLEKAQTAEADARTAAAKVRVTEANPGTDIITTDVKTGKEIGRVAGPPLAAKPIKAENLNQAELGAAAQKLYEDINNLRQTNPLIDQQAGAILTSKTYVDAIPLMKNKGDAITAAIKAGAKGPVLAYLRMKLGFMDNIIRTRINGGRLSGKIYDVYAGELLPGPDSNNPEAVAAMRENERQAILSAIGKSGFDDNPDVWKRAAKRHGAHASVEDLIAGMADSNMDRIQQAYP